MLSPTEDSFRLPEEPLDSGQIEFSSGRGEHVCVCVCVCVHMWEGKGARVEAPWVIKIVIIKVISQDGLFTRPSVFRSYMLLYSRIHVCVYIYIYISPRAVFNRESSLGYEKYEKDGGGGGYSIVEEFECVSKMGEEMVGYYLEQRLRCGGGGEYAKVSRRKESIEWEWLSALNYCEDGSIRPGRSEDTWKRR